jgi:hypothetical protein
MHEVDAIIGKLESIRWFELVGQECDITTSMSIVRMKSWQKALQTRNLNDTSNAFLEGVNHLTHELSFHFRKESRKWNDYAGECRVILEEDIYPVVDSIIDSTPELNEIEAGVYTLRDSVRWDLSHIVMEHVYSDLVPPRLYTLLLEVYQAGHFPCGWDEVWPNGKLWVY